jgi:hypothetical protein
VSDDRTKAGRIVKVGNGQKIVGAPVRNKPRVAGTTKEEPTKTVSVL